MPSVKVKTKSLSFQGVIKEAQKKYGMSANAAEVFVRRYVRKGPDGNLSERAEDTFWRVANSVAEPDKVYEEDYEKTRQSFYHLLSNFLFVPNSPTWTGAGTPLGQLAACFVLPIKDDLGRDPQGIFSTLRVAALIQQTGGGNGFSFSRLRPRGDFVSRSGGRSTGPIGFLKAYDASFGVIAQGGVRRGANMAVLRVDHPDIRAFIHCKEKEGEISNFNISVAATDEFMKAVEEGKKFALRNPKDGKVMEEVDARALFDEHVRFAHHNGEPGVLFIDAANRDNPVSHLYELEATNPCGEQWLGPYENCCLGSVNLARHLTRDGKIDWKKLAQTVRTSVLFLGNVVDANKYVPEVPELQEAAHRVRRIGLGIMGLADVMYALEVRYGSREGIDCASQIMEFVQYHTMLSSIERAKNRGPFPAITGSIYDQKGISWEPQKPLYRHKLEIGRPKISWKKVLEVLKKYGIRNGAQGVIAPTGTIATVADCEGYGCEPVFALAYTRRLFQAAGEEGRKVELRYTSPLFERALKRVGVEEKVREDIYAQVLEKGSCQQVSRVPAKVREVYVVSADITPDEHIEIQAALQRFVDNSISKTCNFPASATEEDVKTAYFKAWKLGCKGLTVYVTGTRKEVVLETEETRKLSEAKSAFGGRKEAEGTDIFIKPRPHAVRGATYRVDTPVGTAFVTVNENGGGNPLEVFVNVGKAGSDITADAEAIGRLSSLILRIDPTMNPQMRVEAIVDQLSGIGGSRTVGFGKERVRSLVDGIAHVLAEYLGDIEVRKKEEEQQLSLGVGKLEKIEPLADLCPECGQATFVFEEGCRKCHSCGFSEC